MGNTCATDNTVKGGDYDEVNPLQYVPHRSSCASAGYSQQETEDSCGGVGRSNSEPASPQIVPRAQDSSSMNSSSSALTTPNESLGYDFEGPLTPVQPVKSGEIHSWLSDSDNERTPGPASPTEVDRLGSSYEHFEDNADTFLAEAAETMKQEKLELRRKRAREADALRRKQKSSKNSFLQSITFALTGKA